MKNKLKQRTSEQTVDTSKTASITPAPSKGNAQSPISALEWFTQATIILALIPLIVYWITLAFEQGYTKYFSVPDYFIVLNPTLILSISRIASLLGLYL